MKIPNEIDEWQEVTNKCLFLAHFGQLIYYVFLTKIFSLVIFGYLLDSRDLLRSFLCVAFASLRLCG